MEGTGRYQINFFKPHTAFLRDNVRLIVISVIVWALAVFGFHILMKLVEKPVPEPGYEVYKQVWSKQFNGSQDEKIELAKVYLTLTGKYISLRTNTAIQGDFSRLVYDLLPADKKPASASTFSQDEQTVKQIAKLLGIEGTLLQEAIPFTLGEINKSEALSTDIPQIMDKHLIHNRSFLTDTLIFGFPFHYFYTAVFLKIIFCLICLTYCKFIDRIMKKHGMEAAHE